MSCTSYLMYLVSFVKIKTFSMHSYPACLLAPYQERLSLERWKSLLSWKMRRAELTQEQLAILALAARWMLVLRFGRLFSKTIAPMCKAVQESYGIRILKVSI